MSGYLYWEQECYTCKKKFKEIDNLGLWKCKKHRGALRDVFFKDVEDLVPIWNCCNRSPMPYVWCTTTQSKKRNPLFNTKPCTKCDHFARAGGPMYGSIEEKNWDDSWILEFKKDIRNNNIRPGLRRQNIHEDCSSLVIHRFDETPDPPLLPTRFLFPQERDLANRRWTEYLRLTL